jgi:hypothetical protein
LHTPGTGKPIALHVSGYVRLATGVTDARLAMLAVAMCVDSGVARASVLPAAGRSTAGPICTSSSISGILTYVLAKRRTFLIEKNQSRVVSIDASAKLLRASLGGVGPCARVLLQRAVST